MVYLAYIYENCKNSGINAFDHFGGADKLIYSGVEL